VAADDEGAGYRKPPKAHQFQKGRSGNPGGRKRKKSPPVSPVDKVLLRKIPVTVDGKEKLASVVEVTMMKLVKKAMEGDPIAIREVVRLEGLRAKARVDEDPTTFQLIIQDPKDALRNHTLAMLGILRRDDEAKELWLEPWVAQAAMNRLSKPLTERELARVRQVLGKDAWF
jgi:hypothetical protein